MKKVIMTRSGDSQLNICGHGVPHIHFARVQEKGRHIEKFSLHLANLKLMTFFTDEPKTRPQFQDTKFSVLDHDICFADSYIGSVKL
jgi:hypothetical protein